MVLGPYYKLESAVDVHSLHPAEPVYASNAGAPASTELVCWSERIRNAVLDLRAAAA